MVWYDIVCWVYTYNLPPTDENAHKHQNTKHNYLMIFYLAVFNHPMGLCQGRASFRWKGAQSGFSPRAAEVQKSGLFVTNRGKISSF